MIYLKILTSFTHAVVTGVVTCECQTYPGHSRQRSDQGLASSGGQTRKTLPVKKPSAWRSLEVTTVMVHGKRGAGSVVLSP